ncbi:hypothetical protein H0H92_007177 [Tricholoma furcatifolium]|nr:hypothetical protein H0H92_007177 [Tricholoma furcatifolium]
MFYPTGATVLRTSANVLDIAGSIVPFVGAAAVIVREISQSCDEIRVHKRKARRMANKCLQLQEILNQQNPDHYSAEMRTKIDEATGVYETIRGRMQRISRTNLLYQIVNKGEIQKSIEKCEDELDQQIKIFQREAREQQQKDNDDIKNILFQILANKGGELTQLKDMDEQARVAEELMLEGQRMLHQGSLTTQASQLQSIPLRQNSDLDSPMVVTDIRSESPPPAESQLHVQQKREIIEKGLIQLHELTGVLPSIKVMNGEVKRIGDLAVAGGTYSDIWQGLWLGQKKVALKALRNIKASDPKAKKRFEQEINIWASLQHEHILPFYGIVTDQGQHIQMVSPWQDSGNVLDYTKKTPGANKSRLLSGAAKGLEYLHGRNIIHGNVKCANILVTAEGEACICDFGMSKIIEDVTEKSASATLTASGSARWLAPELIEGSVTTPTKEADIYSYAMAMLELITGKHPFANRRRDASVIHDIVVLKKTPIRPTEPDVIPWLSDNLWTLMNDCWKPAALRPSMEQVASRVVEIEQGVDKGAQLEPIPESDAMDTS